MEGLWLVDGQGAVGETFVAQGSGAVLPLHNDQSVAPHGHDHRCGGGGHAADVDHLEVVRHVHPLAWFDDPGVGVEWSERWPSAGTCTQMQSPPRRQSLS